MIKLLDIYIAKKFISTLVFILLMGAIVIVIFDLSEKVDDLIGTGITIREVVVDYYLNFIPGIINLISPLVIFISALYFTARLADHTEVIAILSSGISYYRFLMPYIAVAVLLAAGDFVLKNYLMPI